MQERLTQAGPEDSGASVTAEIKDWPRTHYNSSGFGIIGLCAHNNYN